VHPTTGIVLNSLIDAKGDLVTATADNTPARLAVGSNDQVLTADSTTGTGLKWAALPASLPTQTGNANRILTTNGTAASWTDTLANLRVDYGVVRSLEEDVNVVASAATGTVSFDVLAASIWFYTSNATANHTLNIRGDGSSTLNSILPVGDSITVVWMNTNGATPFYPNVIQIDGVAPTVRWQGGTAPSAGNASSIDVYTFTIIKTAATPTYTVLGSQTRFA
jgi:hypothetical protein